MPAAKNKRIVVIGGGTGTYTALLGLKKYTPNLTAIVSMSDSGGSARKERDEFGMLPVSDVRKALVALADENDGGGLLRELFNYRFSEGVGISGSTFGNLFLVALSNVLGSQEEAIKKASTILKIRGRVLPVTLQNTHLVATYEDGKTLVGEHEIDEKGNPGKRVVELSLLPQARALPAALRAIREADAIIVGPGDIYTSLLPPLLVRGVAEAIRRSKVKKIFVVNLMSKYDQTYRFTALDHLKEIEKYLGGKTFDYVVINSKPIPKKMLARYTRAKDHPVKDDLRNGSYKVIRGSLLSTVIPKKQKGDTLPRSFIRHDPERLARAIMKIF